jgi:hypothetical protein
MFIRYLNFVWMFLFVSVVCIAPVSAAAEEEAPPEWVLPYAILLLFLGLTILILARSAKRSDTTFTEDEIRAQKEAAIKLKSGH